MVRERVPQGSSKTEEGGTRGKTEGGGSADCESRYIRKYKSIQDGAEERCLACR